MIIKKRVFVALAEDLSSVSSTHISGSQPSSTPGSMEPMTSSGLCDHLWKHACKKILSQVFCHSDRNLITIIPEERM